jgi:putative ABC transport system ATP-binding protein
MAPGRMVLTPARQSEPLVLLDDVQLRLEGAAGPVDILRGISLAIMPGETVALVGPSGSGKSSLMMIVAGIERPSAGRVVVAGQDLALLDESGLARMRRHHVGIVFQSFHLLPTMTARENVAVPLELAGRRDAFALAEAALRRVGLGHRLGHYPGQLSGGEQQRVAIARAFVAGPALLMADEPTGNLDRATGEAVIDYLFGEHARLGSALLLITHDAALAERCGRRLDLADGRIIGEHGGEHGVGERRAGEAAARPVRHASG